MTGIFYGSTTGSTEAVAQDIAKQLGIINLGHGCTFRVSHSVLLYQKDGPPNGATVFCRDYFDDMVRRLISLMG